MFKKIISVGWEWDLNDPGVDGICCHSLWLGPNLHWIGTYTNLDPETVWFSLWLPCPFLPSHSRVVEVEKIFSFLRICLILHGGSQGFYSKINSFLVLVEEDPHLCRPLFPPCTTEALQRLLRCQDLSHQHLTRVLNPKSLSTRPLSSTFPFFWLATVVTGLGLQAPNEIRSYLSWRCVCGLLPVDHGWTSGPSERKLQNQPLGCASHNILPFYLNRGCFLETLCRISAWHVV